MPAPLELKEKPAFAAGRRKRAIRKLWSKYRLLLINDNTFKEC